MAALIAQNLAPIMFVALVALLLLGYPVAFTLGAVGLGFFVIGVELAPYSAGSINLSWPLLQSLPERVLGVMANETLLAIPFFTFMGLMLERSGMAEDLLDTVGQLFGTARGGLAYAVIFVGALLAATTGVVAASVIAMGLISLPIMLRYGYDHRLASGVIAASGTLAQIIPPSLVLIVLADQLGRSVGAMYAGAFLPGLLLALFYAAYVFIVSRIAPAAVPGLPAEAIGCREESGGRGLGSLALLAAISAIASWWIMRDSPYQGADRVILNLAAAVAVAFSAAVADWLVELATGKRLLSRLARQVTFVMVPPLLLIFLVLGTIFIGLATPTEGGAMGALGAMLLACARRLVDGNPKRFNLALVRSASEATARLSAFVLFILIGARVFSLTFYGINGHLWVERLFTSLPGGETGFLVVVNVLVFVLAFFLDFFELAFIVVPLIAPVADRLGIDLVWFGVMLAVNMQTSFMHPPFGFALFFLRSVAPREAYFDKLTGRRTEPVTTGQIYWGAAPFLVIQLAMVALVVLFPGLVLREEPARPAPALAPISGEPPAGAAVRAPIGGLVLPGTPPRIPGAPPVDPRAPTAPVLDLSLPPPSLSERAPPDSR